MTREEASAQIKEGVEKLILLIPFEKAQEANLAWDQISTALKELLKR